MVCSIDDIVSRRPGKHTRFPTVLYLRSYLLYFLTVARISLPFFFLFFIFIYLSLFLSVHLFLHFSVIVEDYSARAAWAFLIVKITLFLFLICL